MRSYLFAVAFVSLGAIGQSNAKVYDMVGIGNESCAQFLQRHKEEAYEMEVVSWVRGFITGFNASNRVQNLSVFDVTQASPEFIMANIVVVCTKDKSKNIFEATTTILIGLPLAKPASQP